MICAIIFMIATTGLGVYTIMNLTSGESKQISDLKEQVAAKEQEIEKIKNETPELQEAYDTISVDLDGVKAAVASAEGTTADKIVLQEPTIYAREAQKYIVVGSSFGIKDSSGAYGIFYKENTKDGTWKKLKIFHQLICSSITSEEKEIMKGLFYCLDSNGDMVTVGADE